MYGNKLRVWKTWPSWSMDLQHGKAVIFLVLTSILSFGSCSGKPSAPLVNKVDLLKRSLDYD
jgi:hypothetical protein